MYAHAVSTVPVSFNSASLAMCRGLERQAAGRIVAVSTLQKVEAGKTVFSEGDDAENVYEVVRGMIKLYKLLPDGRRQITGFLSAGHLMGVAAQDLYLYSAEAITDVVMCRYPRARFDRLVDEVPGFARRLLSATSDELRAAQDQMLLLGRKTAIEKIATFLLALAELQSDAAGSDADGATEMTVPMGRNDIADYLGLTTETVSRTLTKLKHDGVIAISTPAHISIENGDRLDELAAGETSEDL